MKIVHMVWGLEIGGIETMLIEIMNEQSLLHDVTLIVINNEVNAKLLGAINKKINICLVRRPRNSKNPYYWLLLGVYLISTRAKIFHVHQDSILKILKFFPGKKVITIHDTGIEPQFSKMYADHIFCISKAVFNDLCAKLIGKSLAIVPNGISVEQFQVKNEYASSAFKVVQIARLDHNKKGQDILLYALALFCKQFPNVPITIDFIGEGLSLTYLQHLAVELNIHERCAFLGSKSRAFLYAHLKDYDLLVQPSRFEGFGLSVVEAIAAQVPVLVSDIEGPMEIIENGKLGYCFKIGNYQDCADTMHRILQDRLLPVFIEEMRIRRQHILETYDVRKTARSYVSEYEQLQDTR